MFAEGKGEITMGTFLFSKIETSPISAMANYAINSVGSRRVVTTKRNEEKRPLTVNYRFAVDEVHSGTAQWFAPGQTMCPK